MKIKNNTNKKSGNLRKKISVFFLLVFVINFGALAITNTKAFAASSTDDITKSWLTYTALADCSYGFSNNVSQGDWEAYNPFRDNKYTGAINPIAGEFATEYLYPGPQVYDKGGINCRDKKWSKDVFSGMWKFASPDDFFTKLGYVKNSNNEYVSDSMNFDTLHRAIIDNNPELFPNQYDPPKGVEYNAHLWTFLNKCGGKEATVQSDIELAKKNEGKFGMIQVYDPATNTMVEKPYVMNDPKSYEPIGSAYATSDGGGRVMGTEKPWPNATKVSCQHVRDILQNKALAADYLELVKYSVGTGAEAPSGAGTAGPDTAAEDKTDCTDVVGVFGWLICELGDKADMLVTTLEGALYKMLRVPELEFGREIYTQWNVFRSMATSLLILIGLVAIAAQVFNLDFISAYTMRKIIPKLIIATILMFLSYYLLSLAISFVNALGNGVASLIMGSFDNGELLKQTKEGGAIHYILDNGKFSGTPTIVASSSAIIMALVGYITAGGAGLLIMGMAVVLFASLTAFVSLIIRKVMIIGLVMIAPLAIVAWILPSTEKWFKKWWETFIKLLIMFPLVMGLLAIGHVGAYLIAQTSAAFSDSASSFEGGITMLMVFVAYFAPYFFIPSMFKTAGGAFATISGALNNKGKDWGKKSGDYTTNAGKKFIAKRAANANHDFTRKLYRGASYAASGAIVPFGMGRSARAATAASNDEMVQKEKKEMETMIDVKLRGLNDTEVARKLIDLAGNRNQDIANAALSQMQKRNMNSELGDAFIESEQARKNIIKKQRTDDAYNSYVKEKHKDLHEDNWNSNGTVNAEKFQANYAGMREEDVLALHGSSLDRQNNAGMNHLTGMSFNEIFRTHEVVNPDGTRSMVTSRAAESMQGIWASNQKFQSAGLRTKDAVRQAVGARPGQAPGAGT